MHFFWRIHLSLSLLKPFSNLLQADSSVCLLSVNMLQGYDCMKVHAMIHAHLRHVTRTTGTRTSKQKSQLLKLTRSNTTDYKTNSGQLAYMLAVGDTLLSRNVITIIYIPAKYPSEQLIQ
jgi:hypothetical protein